MTGMLDNMKDKMGGMSEEAKARMQQLQADAKSGNLSDEGKAELEKLRARFEHHGE